ncbi:SemiSWEET transporter [Parvimonas parva]|uniref:SemiSWEET transporter n=1 Tax=Parvimonas parva TaxID=2769485 RepID=UPI0038B31843
MIGIVAACLTTFAFAPQVIKVMKDKNTKSLSLLMCFMQTIGIFLWLVHGIFIKDFALIFANSISFVMVAIILLYKIRYVHL